MFKQKRLLTVLFGAAALTGLTYGVARRGLQRRAADGSAAKGAHRAFGDANVNVDLSSNIAEELDEHAEAGEWDGFIRESERAARESERVLASDRLSSVDPLDLALNLGGVFDGEADDSSLTARPSDRVPAPYGGDDEDAPSADDLGQTWLAQATQAERSFSEPDLVPDLENLSASAEDETTGAEDQEEDEAAVEDREWNDSRS